MNDAKKSYLEEEKVVDPTTGEETNEADTESIADVDVETPGETPTTPSVPVDQQQKVDEEIATAEGGDEVAVDTDVVSDDTEVDADDTEVDATVAEPGQDLDSDTVETETSGDISGDDTEVDADDTTDTEEEGVVV